MLRVWSDFNGSTTEGDCAVVSYNHMPLENQLQTLGLSKGSQVILYQDEDDFEVIATLDFKFADVLGREAWVAIPDWSTIKRFE